MYPWELIKSVRLITEVCLEVAPGDHVLCIADQEEKMEVVNLIAADCKMRGAEVAVVVIEPRKERQRELPRPVARAMKEADVIITMAEGLIMTKARVEACAAGAKFAMLGGTNKEYLAGLDLAREDLLEVRALTERIVQRLSAASSAHLTTRAGTDLHMSLKGRNGVGVVPFIQKGGFGGIPVYAEAACPPVEDSVEGVAIVDGTMVGNVANFEGVVEEPFEIQFEKGRIVRLSKGKDAKRLESLLNAFGEQTRTFSELGVNSNHKIPKRFIGKRADNAIAGHVHLGLGRNDHIGGNSKGEIHLDVMVTWATLLLDGDPILENGNLKI